VTLQRRHQPPPARAAAMPRARCVTLTPRRLDTLDQGAPVSVCTVSRELGHGSEELVRRIYGTSVRSAIGRRWWSSVWSNASNASAIAFVICLLAPGTTPAIGNVPKTRSPARR